MVLPVQPTPALPPAEEIVLSDDLCVTIRPIQPQDAKALQVTFGLLSPESIYYRFLSFKKELTDQEAERFANVDYRTHMAFVAVGEVEGKSLILGVARYALLDPKQPDLAESAVVVADEYQHHGLGRHLLGRMVTYARAQGVRYLRGVILPENQRMIELIKKGGFPFQQRYVEGAYQITIDIGL